MQTATDTTVLDYEHFKIMSFSILRIGWEPYDLRRLRSIGIRSRIHWGVQVGIFLSLIGANDCVQRYSIVLTSPNNCLKLVLFSISIWRLSKIFLSLHYE